MGYSADEISQIVKSVMDNLEKEGVKFSSGRTSAAPGMGFKSVKGDSGIFERTEDAIEAAYAAQKNWCQNYNLKDREKIISEIRKTCLANMEDLARRVWEETGMGRYEDKIQKHFHTINGTPGTECLKTAAISGDSGLMLEEMGPFGVIGAITPSTNPTETIINNTISMIAGGNSVVFNVHPGAKKSCAHCLQLIHDTIVRAGGPENLITMTREPSMESVDVLTQSPKIRLMTGTGGMGMVNALLRSGKKTIGAGAGNPPVVVDETADLDLAAREIYRGASFDNNIMCFAEKEVFAVESVEKSLVSKLMEQGAHLITREQADQLLKIVFLNDNGRYSINRKWVGKNASVILESIGIQNKDTRLIICEVEKDHPFVTVEQLMPILPIVACRDFEEAAQAAITAESGNRHTASMFSKNVDNMTYLARSIETTIFVKNGATLKGVGIGGEGHVTMTIAGPTGEGLTCARSFTRSRRCQLADGGLRVV